MDTANTIYTTLTIILEVIALILIVITAFIKIKEKINKNKNKLDLVMDFTEIFIKYAKQYLSTKTGPEKMEFVVDRLHTIAKNYGVNISKSTLKELAQTTYNELKKLEDKANKETNK